MNWRRRTGEIVDRVHFDIQRKANVVAHELETGICMQMRDVRFRPGEEIVDAQHFVAGGDEPVDQMLTEEPGPAGDQDAPLLEVSASHVQPFEERLGV